MSTDNFLDGSRHADWTDYPSGGSISESGGVVTISVPAAGKDCWDDVFTQPSSDASPAASGDFDTCVKVKCSDWTSIGSNTFFVFVAYTTLGSGTKTWVGLEIYYENDLGNDYFGVRRIDTINSVSSITNMVDLEINPESTYDIWLRIKRFRSTFYTYYCTCDANDNGHPRAWTALNYSYGTEYTTSSDVIISIGAHNDGAAFSWDAHHYEFAQAVSLVVEDTFNDESSTIARQWIEHEGAGNGNFEETSFPGFMKSWITTGNLYWKGDTHNQLSQYVKAGATIYAQTQNQSTVAYQGSGLCFRYDYNHFGALMVESNTNKRYVYAYYWEGDTFMQSQIIDLSVSGDSAWSNESAVHLKLIHSSGTGRLAFYYSLDGTSYTEIKASDGTSDFYFTSAENAFWVGLASYSEGAPQINVKYDYFSASAPSAVSSITSDEFDDGSVSGDWTQDLNGGSLSEANDQLTFTMSTGDLIDANDGGWIYQPIYGDFTIYTQLKADWAANGQSAGLIYKLNDNNKVLVLLRYEDGRAYVMRYDVVDGVSYEGIRYPLDSTSISYGLKLSRTLNTFTAAYGPDLLHLTTLPAPSTSLSCGSNGFIGLCAFSDGASAIDSVWEFWGTSIIQDAIAKNSVLWYEYPGRLDRSSVLFYGYVGTIVNNTTLLYSYELREWINKFTTLLYSYSVKGWTSVSHVLKYNYIRRWVEKLKTTLTTFAPGIVYLTWEYSLPDGWPTDTQPVTFGIYVDGVCVINNVIENQAFLPDMEENVTYVIDVFANVFKNQIYSIDRSEYGRKVKIVFALSTSGDVDHYSIYGDNGTGTIDYDTELDRVEIKST